MNITIFGYAPLRNVTNLYTLPIVLSVFLTACSETANDSSPNSLAKTPSQTLNNAEILDFSIREGQIFNQFFRQGPVSAHTVLTSGTHPRLVVAFPAGNSGVSLWFRLTKSEVYWHDTHAIRGMLEHSRDGEPLYGIESEITVDAAQLTVDKAVLGICVGLLSPPIHSLVPRADNLPCVHGAQKGPNRSRLYAV